MMLDQLRFGQRGWIIGVSGAGIVRKKLLDMGLTKDAPVEMCGSAPFGDPIWVRVRGTFISLRRGHAAMVQVELESM